MTTSYWAPTAGKSVPSGGATQLTVAGTKGDNLGNWLSKAYGSLSNITKEPSNLLKLGMIAACVILVIFLLKKKHRK